MGADNLQSAICNLQCVDLNSQSLLSGFSTWNDELALAVAQQKSYP
ncbi:hypothetical protein COO91_08193 [Nostoc flagelliforme CCNUN1]|uniref:Uncharacterized protein n=1 Tax=Nostoc flagelliforme CCNUN1 TaxID=2038116 RepID=A0A2K8T2Z5_9NOSO|nr:hypothetical protein COO91_08193 [Nostoc flagelliforme CCNUN1]